MALRQKGVNVFIDDKLSRGEQISESLFRSIEEALISIVIFSENYASSSWCLDELVKIIECKKSKGQIVWPIFYKVNPSDIRKQTESFGEALATHQAKFKTKIQIWRETLTTAANLSGWDLGTRKEADLIQDLVKEVLSILNLICTPLYVAKYPVGIDYQLETLRLHSHYWTEDEPSISVYMVGIYGIGGIGKTTFAKALYNKIANQFEACCFISKVRETSKQFNGLVQLQENLLHEILKENLKVGNLDRGINIIKHRLCSQKVLIALDDVDKLEQLGALVGGRDWFGPGSIIIVTTRNNHLLSIHEFDQKYGIQGMNHDDALELFSWHAFKKSHPPSAYVDLSKRATSYCKGHPLALVVLGSFLCTRDDEAEWRSILDEFENSLSKDISDILRISFDGLEEKVKEIFLDISCFLVGEKVEYVKNILNACHFNADFGIIVLIDLSLVTVEYNKVQMHDLVRHMTHKIVNGESFEPGKRSRLWLVQDVLKVFADNSGTDAIRAIKLELPNPTKLEVNPRALRNMKNLRLLIVQNARFSTNLKCLPDNLRWIEWHGFTQESLPSCFITKNLVGLNLQHSLIKNLDKVFKDGTRLKVVDLSYSTSSEKFPNFSALSSLEELYLIECTSLRKIPESIGSLNKLVILDLRYCSNIKKLPSYLMLDSLEILNLSYCKRLEGLSNFSTISNLKGLYLNNCTNLRVIHESVGSLDSLVDLNLAQCTKLEKLPSYLRIKSLKFLNLSGCCKLKMFPEFDESMTSLNVLNLDFTAIKELPSSIGYLTELLSLNLHGCTNLISFHSTVHRNFFEFKVKPMFFHLAFLNLENCNMSNANFLKTLCHVTRLLHSLNLSRNKFSSLPSCLHKFTTLQNLILRNCKFLQKISSLPPHIERMDATGCESLARCHNFVDMLSSKQVIKGIQRHFIIMNGEIPEKFYRTISNPMKVSFRHYPNMERTLTTYVMFKVDRMEKLRDQGHAVISFNKCYSDQDKFSFNREFPSSTSEYMWLISITSNISTSSVANGWNHVIVWFDVLKCFAATVTIKNCGIHLTDEIHGIQNDDIRGPGVIYTDFDRLKELVSDE
ncbi:TMV resistance protein N-like [Cucurbita moschata]|uniref:TMV resistance protein N-like n=1 Tax=Cucurbita moschata TaxID=3662 RepID=A0A6J1G361_CUCMO|nr:TMV resistance protein N-like [Cucurbita moschata]